MREHNVVYAEVNVEDIRGRLIRNPNYGGPPAGYKGWTWRPQLSKHRKEGFNEALMESIAEEGVRNPVLLWNLSEGLFLTFGGSRVCAVENLGLRTVPAIINDCTGEYGEEGLVTEDNWRSYFRDVPVSATFDEEGHFDYHYNLERARRQNHDPSGFAWVKGQPNWIKKEFPWIFTSTQDNQK